MTSLCRLLPQFGYYVALLHRAVGFLRWLTPSDPCTGVLPAARDARSGLSKELPVPAVAPHLSDKSLV